MKGIVVGCDLSLRSPAIVALPLDWRPGDWHRVRSWARSNPLVPGHDLRRRYERYIAITNWVCSLVSKLKGKAGREVHCYIEDYAYKRNNRSASSLMELGGHVRCELLVRLSLVAQSVPPSTARKILLGKLPRKGQHKIAAKQALAEAGAPAAWIEDERDACVVANFGLFELGGKPLTLASSLPARIKGRPKLR